jgi:tRNA(Arg) A34 adenosine deaminase TadA
MFGTTPSSSRSWPAVPALLPVNISRSTLPMSVQPCRMCGAMAAACSDVRTIFMACHFLPLLA